MPEEHRQIRLKLVEWLGQRLRKLLVVQRVQPGEQLPAMVEIRCTSVRAVVAGWAAAASEEHLPELVELRFGRVQLLRKYWSTVAR
jgi:hypothetical protein